MIEAIFENLEAKRALLADLEARMRPDAVLATNTSSLRLEDIATALARSRAPGRHPLLQPGGEDAAGRSGRRPPAPTRPCSRRACAFVRAIDKLPLPVKSAPGFLVNAVLAPYMLEAMRCVDEGIAPETVDAAMLAFGMPMGPIELADTVGLDIALAAGQQLAGAAEAAALPGRTRRPRRPGPKSGRGFYAYRDGKPAKGAGRHVRRRPGDTAGDAPDRANPRPGRDGIVADADLADAGVIFGTGFAPFTGGPLRYADGQKQ